MLEGVEVEDARNDAEERVHVQSEGGHTQQQVTQARVGALTNAFVCCFV